MNLQDTFALGSLSIRRLGFGTMQLTGPGVWGEPSDRQSALTVLRRAETIGVDFFDTADSYGPHVAEDLLREALYPYSETLTIATKAGFMRTGPSQWEVNGHPDYLRRQCEGSLTRLGLERIDLFQLHRVDPRVAEEDQFGLLKTLRDEGKVLEVGLSEINVAQIEAARNIVPIVSVQNRYNLADRGADDVVEYCARHQIAFIPWFPLASGVLSLSKGVVAQVARDLSSTPSQLSLAWLLRRSPVMVPIPGTSSLAHLEENCAATDIAMSDTQFEALTSMHGVNRAARRGRVSRSRER